MTLLHAIDPGTHSSAFVTLEPATRQIVYATIQANHVLLEVLSEKVQWRDQVAIEMVACYGMPVGAETFETCVWIGRFWERVSATPVRLITRNEIKMALCYTVRGVNDAAIRQRLIDMYTLDGVPALGTKAHPGPLYGIKSHLWAALAVAIGHLETAPNPGELQ